ncbi:hypothetical protein [Polynucleobacter sp. AP-Sving-400A-A2]|uniref:hypothetical protein n=1 Tax=Polynucleobacter sp. AP-Sving-400A-A2 TaxID=2081049 RepID=UPI001BFEA214|nr:hypothetical protein [Polynucleobacter sp. AP-Sving-400A-A2]QWE13764.1 hypothetical protein C2758_06105 [Polynucleobacter sp. AP-Sving-400A-A2]
MFNPEPWTDEDDAPELTAEDLKRSIWSVDGKVVPEAEGRAAFAKKLKELDCLKDDS